MQATTNTIRPTPQSSMSFSRLEPHSLDPLALVTSNGSPNLSEVPILNNGVTESPDKDHNDVFFADIDDAPPTNPPTPLLRAPQGFDDLPIEIKSLTERFVESLSAKVHPTPLSIDALGDLFQEFYIKAEKPIATHISALASKISRENSLTSIKKRKNGDGPEQQMLTASELQDRKQSRKLLEQKRLALEEAVERAACEKVYAKIWHHRSSEDQEMDQKLRSRIAALSLVGIGLKELLLSGTEDLTADVRRKTIEREEDIKQSLGPARTAIQDMTNEKYPLGKLLYLINAHKSIVETLSNFFPSSSSADEILPTIIYTLLTSPPGTINVISDLHFIQRFRASNKVDGEAAYCLVNLEAAISFLETVELPSLRSDEALAGPEKALGLLTSPRKETEPMALGITPVDDPLADSEPFPSLDTTTARPQMLPPASTRSSRSLSELIQAQATKLDAASDSFRVAVLDSADHAVGAMTNTVENSFRFLFGRIREEQQTNSPGATDIPVPRTLEDVQKLVSTPPLHPDDGSWSGSPRPEHTIVDDPLGNGAKIVDLGNNRVLDLVGGRRLRDRSADSSRSGGSGKRVSFAATDPLSDKAIGLGLTEDPLSSTPPKIAQSISPGPTSPMPLMSSGVESMRNLGNSLNPLNQFAKISLFGRAVPATGPTSAPMLSAEHITARPISPVDNKALVTVDIIRKMQKPSRKFVECKSSDDLKVGDLEELLAEYKRMAAAISKLQSS
jgi:hypothetical protein